MVVLSLKAQRELRSSTNKRIVEDVKNDEYKPAINVWASWFPERPVIKKDDAAIKKLYGDSTDG